MITVGSRRNHPLLLFLASCAALYFELVVIRYLAAEIRVFAYLKNMPLIASFFGIGLGMILGAPPPRLRRAFPALSAVLFLLIANAYNLNLTHMQMPTSDVWEFSFGRAPVSFSSLVYLLVVIYFPAGGRGGLLENLVMVGGTPLLAIMAIALYTASVFVSPGIRRTQVRLETSNA